MFNVNDIRNDFPMFSNNKDLIYFDNSATSFKPNCVIDAVINYYCFNNTNIHRGDYNLSYRVSKAYEDTRKTIAKLIHANDERCIVYTNGSTSSLNIIAYGYGLKYLKKDDVILTSYLEHASNILPWYRVCEKTGAKLKFIELNEDGTFNIDKYKSCFVENVKIVCLPYISNVLGYINPIKDIIDIAHEHNAIVSVDGAQALPHIDVDVNYLDIDLLSFSSHKMLGPTGIGILYGKYELLDMMDPFMLGGDSNARFDKDLNLILKKVPYKFESGTPCIEGVLGLNEACLYLMKLGLSNIDDYCKDLTEYFMNKLSALDNVIIYNRDSRSGIVTFNIKGIFSQDVASYLNKMNIAVRSGNHCAKLLHNIIGVDDTVRASLYFYNTKEEIDKFVDIVKDITLEKCVESIL